jgi:AcrR family transcriptional regulator
MPTTARKQRPDRTKVRTSIIQTACEIAAADSWSAVTVRKVAERIGYTAPIIYEHFGSKDEMLDQILKQTYDDLGKAIMEATLSQPPGEDRVRAIVLTYWQFAHETPELYHLMYGMEGARATSEDAREYAAPIVKFVVQQLQDFNPERITKDNVMLVMVEAWSMVHGVLALSLSGYTLRYLTDEDQLLDALVADVLCILRRQ